MKTILILFSTLFLGLSPLLETKDSKDVLIENLTFDAYEGGYFFFTDANDNPKVLEMNAATSINSKLLTKNEVTRKKYQVHYKVGTLSKDSSSEGFILHLELIK